MSNRVIKDSIWSSPTLSKMKPVYQLHFPRWLLMSDDWGCFNADPDIIKGLAYPKFPITTEDISEVRKAFNVVGLLFTWVDNDREWGYFPSWDNHHSYCNKTNVDDEGKNQKHRRKTPVPPKKELEKYLNKFKRNI